MQTAFFGGSFDPPHLGHIAVARAAQQALHLDQILFAPVGLQPLKPGGPSASFQQRVAMTQLAIEAEPNFELSEIDAPNRNSNTPNYTSDTLIRLRHQVSPATQLYFLIGADSFRALPQWHRAADIPFLANLIVAARPHEDISDLAAHLPPSITASPLPAPGAKHYQRYLLCNQEGAQARLYILPNLNFEISATQLRQQIQGRPSHQPPLLAPAVLQYIHQNHLYQ